MILYNPTVSGSLLVTGSLTTTGTITSQTLVVQTITSSIEFVTGSTRNGSLAANTHEFTGSVLMSGSVGIGNSSPSGKLHLTGASSSADLLFLNTSGANTNFALKITGAASDYLTIRRNHPSGGDLDIMSFTYGGNVGIGTTSPSARLHTEVAVEGTGTGAVALIAKTSNGVNDIFRWFDGSTQLGVFKNNGNVGIKTTSPGAALHVVGNQFIAKSGGGGSGTYKQTVVGQTTAAASGVAKTVAYVGHTNALTVYVWATQSGSSGTTAVATIVTIYGAGTGNVVGGTSMGGVTGINVAYNNSGYVLTISVTYSGAAPTINYVIDGINDGNDIYTI
jgi:hypothetical protein